MAFETKLTPVQIGLSEMLDALWHEIQTAAIAAQTRGDGRFAFEEAEIEVAIAVEAETKSKFNLHVVEFGGGLTGSRTATVRIKVRQYTEELAAKNPECIIFLAKNEESGTETQPASTAVEAMQRNKSTAAQGPSV